MEKAAALVLTALASFAIAFNSVTPTAEAISAEKPLFASAPMCILENAVRVRSAFGQGSGVIISPKHVLTANHVVEGDDSAKIRIELPQYNASVWQNASVIRRHVAYDVALLEIETTTFGKGAAIADSESISIGSPLFAVGAGAGCSPLLATLGYLAAKRNDGRSGYEFLWQSSNAIFYGNSGGGIYNANTNELVGIAVQGAGNTFSMAPNVTIFVPAHILRKFLKITDGQKNAG